MPVIALWAKGIQDSLGFWIPRCGFQIPGTGFQSLSVEPRDYDLFSLGRTWIPDSLSSVPDSKTQDSGVHKQKFHRLCPLSDISPPSLLGYPLKVFEINKPRGV